MTAPLFTITTRQPDPGDARGVTIVDVSGEVDANNAAIFGRALREVAGTRPLIANLSDLSYLDSAGFAMLDRLLGDHTLRIVLEPHSPIRAAADLMNLPCYDTIGQAMTRS